jgi:drug/metabolite transporter superfamily protein YnfA
MMLLIKSLFLFVVAGLFEIGGGWLVWKWLRDARPAWWGLIGAVAPFFIALACSSIRLSLTAIGRNNCTPSG